MILFYRAFINADDFSERLYCIAEKEIERVKADDIDNLFKHIF